MTSRRIVFLQHDSNPLGGVGRVLLTLVKGLQRQGYESHVVLPQAGGLEAELAKIGAEVRVIPIPVFPQRSRLGGARYLSGLPERVSRIADYLDTVRADIVHTNTGFVFEGALAALRTARPHVWHFHNELERDAPAALFLALAAPPSTARDTYCMLSDCVVGVSPGVSRYYEEAGNCRVTTIPNGISLTDFDHLARSRRSDLRSELGLPNEAVLVGSVGRVTQQKNFELLVDTARVVCAQSPQCHFVVIGPLSSSATVERVRSRIREYGLDSRVHLIGERDDVEGLLDQLDVFLLTSRTEGFGMVVIEAMAASRPVVSTRCGGPESIVRHEVTGYLTAPDDPAELARSIGRLLAEPVLRHEMGHAGRKRVEAEFEGQVFADRFAALYEQCIQAPRHDNLTQRRLVADLLVGLTSWHAETALEIEKMRAAASAARPNSAWRRAMEPLLALTRGRRRPENY